MSGRTSESKPERDASPTRTAVPRGRWTRASLLGLVAIAMGTSVDVVGPMARHARANVSAPAPAPGGQPLSPAPVENPERAAAVMEARATPPDTWADVRLPRAHDETEPRDHRGAVKRFPGFAHATARALAPVPIDIPRERERRLAHSVADATDAARPAGRIDREATARLARREVEQWASSYCYRRALRDDPGLSGRLDIRLQIASSGRVSNVDVQPALNHQLTPAVRLHDCVQRGLRGRTFPPPTGGDAQFAFALQLSPGQRF